MPKVLTPLPIAYDVTGSGPVIVLLHGSLLSRAIWRGYGYVAALTQTHTVVRIDLRGHGLSAKPHDPADYTLRAMEADVLAVLDAEGIDRATLLGYSLGARLSLALTLDHPDRVTHLISLGGSAADQSASVDQIFFPGAIDVLASGDMEEFCARQGLGPEVADPRDKGTRRAFLAADPLAMAALFTATDATAGYPDTQLAACPVPALWMAGDRDRPRHEESRHAAGVMPRGRFVSLPGRTHGSTLAPTGPVLDQVLPFVAEP